jgi:tetrapyrrole methylase family protein/MazG family protein
MERLLEVMSTLRSPQGCPWDREQNLDTLKRFLIEETYEVIDAIEDGDHDRLCEELGDLLLQIVFQAQICSEEGVFSFSDVANAIVAKLVRRHPHVFGSVEVENADEVLRNWDDIKRTEKGENAPRSALEGLSRHLPALQRAYEMQKRAARQGFDWARTEEVLDKLDEEIRELREAQEAADRDRTLVEFGDVLFSMVNLARFMNVDPEEALRGSGRKFAERFQEVERRLEAEGRVMKDCTLAELDVIWDAVKEDEGDSAHE